MSKRPRILMLTPELPSRCGGIGWHVHYLTQELRARGWHVTLALRTDGRGSAPPGVIPVHGSGVPLLGAHGLMRRLRRLLGEQPHDLVMVHGTPLGAWGQTVPVLLMSHWCIAEGCRRVAPEGHDLKAGVKVALNRLYVRAERRSVLEADSVAVVSDAMRREVLRHHGRSAVVVGNAVDTERFHPARDWSALGRGVLFVSGLRSGKGVPEVLEIARRVRAAGCGIPLRIVGRGPLEGWLRRKVASSRLDGLSVLPFLSHEELPAVYRASSVLLLPSHYEGLPTTVLEAMASGLPVVATDAGGTREAVETGATGFLHPVDDIEGMAESIIRLDASPGLACRLGTAGRRLVEREFSWPVIAGRYEAVMQRLLGICEDQGHEDLPHRRAIPARAERVGAWRT